MFDPNVLTAMVLSNGVLKGLEGAADAFGHVLCAHDDPMTSLIATLARIKVIEALLLKSAVSESSKSLEDLVDLSDKVETAVYLNSIVVGLLTKDEAVTLMANRSKSDKLLSTFEAAQKHSTSDSSKIAGALSTLTDYLSKK